MTATSRARVTFLAAASLLVVACGGDGPTPPPPPPPTLQPGTIQIVNGPFSAQVGRDVTVQVRILDTSGAPLASVLVGFATQNGGSVTPTQATTGSDGIATTVWTLAGDLGTQTLSVVAGSVTELVNATALLGDPARIVAISGDGQTTALQTTLATPLVAEVQDEFAHALGGVAVTFTVAPGDGAASPAEATSAPDGRVSTTWTVGTIAGSRQLSAQATGIAAAEFTANVLPGPAAGLSASQGDAQNGVGSLPLDDPVVLLIQDGFGNPVANQAVTFAVTGGGGSFDPVLATTDEAGNASSTWILGPGLGAQTATATVAGVPPLALSATATEVVGPPASVSIVGGDSQTSDPGEAVDVPPTVAVVDAADHPVPGLAVTFAVTGGGGSVTGGNAMTDFTGRARPDSWVLGPNPGPNTLDAAVAGLAPVTFTAEGEAPLPVGSFNIDVRFLTVVSAAQREAYERAALRWRQIIIGDLAPEQVDLTEGSCGQNSPAINELVDDLIILASSIPIDGVGGTLGFAGPCLERGNLLTVVGAMTFDDADMRQLEQGGRLDDVILHEMGHVLGLGIIWQDLDLLVDGRGGDPFFTGAEAITQFFAIGGQAANPVPVQVGGGHWRESVFGNEFMTPFIDDVNPVSKVTIGSMQDLGYEVNIDADDGFTLPIPAAAPALRGTPYKLNEVSLAELRRILEARQDGGGGP